MKFAPCYPSYQQKIFSSLKYLVVAVVSLMVMPPLQADVAQKNIGDLEIYQAATDGQINLMMMLDTSGSMGISSLVLPKDNPYGSPGDVTNSLCGTTSSGDIIEWKYNAIDKRAGLITTNKNTFYKAVTVNNETVPYYLRGCAASNSATPYIDAKGKLVESETGKFDRLSRLKDALIQLLASSKISDSVSMGLGNFSSKTPILIGTSSNKLVDGHSGSILVPAAPLTAAQRAKLIKAVASFQSVDTETDQYGNTDTNLASNSATYPDIFKASSGTPTVHAYAEAGAYMMGTNTGVRSTALPSRLNVLYDGSIVMQKTGTTSISDQVYYICVQLGSRADAEQFGAKIKQCDNAWNSNEINPNNNNAYGTWYDASNKQMGSNIAIYKPNGTGGWTVVTPAQLKAQVGDMTTTWETHSKLPIGWRYGGWMKVANSPLDIEPINTKGYSNSGGATAYVSYRASPFSIETTNQQTTNQGFLDCPTGYTPIANWQSLCTKSVNLSRNATFLEITSGRCLSPVDGSVDPLPNARDPNGNLKNDEHYNLKNSIYKSGSLFTSAQCNQTTSAVVRPWGYLTVEVPADNNYGGMVYSASEAKNSAGTQYIRGATPTTSNTAKCDSNGIYFLTDGAPNSTKDNMAATILNTSLNNDSKYTLNTTKPLGLTSPALQSGLFSGETGGWEWIGEYAKRLNNSSKNPSGVAIRTAVAGFGSSFAGLTYNDSTKLYNCTTSGATPDAQNACKWGQQGEGYGEGGFFYAQSADDIANSVLTFIKNLKTTIPAAPSGTITVPDDPYRADSQLAVAYYPMVEAKVSEAKVIWPGNVKKYNLKEGTLLGKSDQALFTSAGGDLNSSTQDLWSNADYSNANNAVTSGGFYAQLSSPNSGISSVRTLYIEDLTATGATTSKLRKLAINTNGKITLDGNIITDSNTFNDITTYSVDNVVKLLKFLGFDNINVATTGTDVAKLSGITLTTANATTPIKIVGATIHSAPTAVSYSATLDDDGRVTENRDDYVLFGSMDGALHLVNTDNYGSSNGGKETFAIIPRAIMNNQADALVKDAVQGNIGAPKAGIDAPWLVTADYKYDFINKKVNIDTSGAGVSQKGVYAYGGLRMGGDGIYGLNLSNYTSPTILFSINPNTTGFERIGQIWAKPTKAKIKTSATDTGTDVLIFGGGYDTCYEDENYQVGTTTSTLRNQRGNLCNRTTSPEALGNAVYIVNAKTGALIWSATKTANGSGSANSTNPYLNNSIVASVTVLDRNNDGFMDGIYFTDLGGQLFRADFTNAGDRTYAKNASGDYIATQQTSFANRRITRMLQPQYAITNASGAITTNANAKYNLRFYERPVVSFFRNDNSKLFAMVNVISGDRSSPLSKLRNAVNADRLYGIIDSDVTKVNSIFFADDFTTTNSNKQSIADIADADLVNIPTSLTASVTPATKTSTISAVKGKKGWYYPLTRFDGYTNVLYNKGVGKSEVINSMLYTTVYNPDMSYGANNPCSAQIVGGSERQLYCLPYGVCTDSASTTGTGGFLRAGQGIQELTLGPYSSSKTNIRLLIGNMTMTQRSDSQNRFNYGSDSKKDNSLLKANQVAAGNLAITQTGGDGSAAEYLYRERYTLNPKTWYEVFN